MRVRRDGGTAIQSRFHSNVAFQQQIIIAGNSMLGTVLCVFMEFA
jgi:hypothetical protein